MAHPASPGPAAAPSSAAAAVSPQRNTPLLKLLLLGDSGVGKSSLMMRFSDQKFVNMISTAGIDFKTKKMVINGKEITLQIWDTAGQERFKTITQAYYRGAMGIVLIYDVTNKQTLQNIRYWMGNIQQHANQSVRKLLVGNKIDAGDARQVTTEEGAAMADEFKIPFLEASAQAGTNVDEMFTSIATDISNNMDKFTPAAQKPANAGTANGGAGGATGAASASSNAGGGSEPKNVQLNAKNADAKPNGGGGCCP